MLGGGGWVIDRRYRRVGALCCLGKNGLMDAEMASEAKVGGNLMRCSEDKER